MNLEEKLQRAFGPLEPSRLEIQPTEPGDTSGMRHITVVLVSELFEDMAEARRQATVWEILLKALTQSEQDRVEFVFTRTLGEAG